MSEELTSYPLLPLRDLVIYPRMVLPLFVGRPRSMRALEIATESNTPILLVAQKDGEVEDPKSSELYRFGCLATVLQFLRLPDGSLKILVEGDERVAVSRISRRKDAFWGRVEPIEETTGNPKHVEVLVQVMLNQLEAYAKLNKRGNPEILTALSSFDEPERLADGVAAHLSITLEEQQELLETCCVETRLEKVLEHLESEMTLLQMGRKIQGRVKTQMEKSQREYYLQEKMKAIQKELGELDGEGQGELEGLEEKLNTIGLSEAAHEKAMTELNRLKMMPPMSAEATVSRTYLDWLAQLPWSQHSEVNEDLQVAETHLDAEHYGLEKVKERILEHLAVLSRVRRLSGPVLCLVGPPGVGKTSLGRSIAKAMGRAFERVSLGGVRDEAEIRGHRRTYIGAMPGKIIQRLAKAKANNCLILLDEIDKMSMDFRGDPASALLEVLDPEQNHAFADHYLEVDYDLSDVIFICTANSMDIPPPLLDRMEVIRLSGYTEEEKLNIAKRHLIPKQCDLTGLKSSEVQWKDTALKALIHRYTREAGVRGLEREIAKVHRKVVRQMLERNAPKKVSLTQRNITDYVGPPLYVKEKARQKSRLGQVHGLAWTQVGGEILTIEAAAVPGKGKTLFTGKLGQVMQESIQTAMTVLRVRGGALGLSAELFANQDFHVHVPEGATPKDGPSAGIGMCTALLSTLAKVRVHSNVAMTGEITLRGEVLPIGGLKEKLLAAYQAGIKTVILPKGNQVHAEEIPEVVQAHLDIHWVQWIEEVWALALERVPAGLKKERKKQGVSARQVC